MCEYPFVRRICAPHESTLPDAFSSEIALLGSEAFPDLDVDADVTDFGLDLNPLPALDWVCSDQMQLPTNTGNALSATTIADAEYDWFQCPDSWTVEHEQPGRQQDFLDDSFLLRFVNDVQRWLQQWASNGHNPFIHHQLYRQRLPRSIQDAYTSLTAYLAKNPKNENLTFRIIEDRVAQLLQDQPPNRPPSSLDILEHLARVQALLVYQVIRLFDGNIRLRAQAEQHSPVLSRWVGQLWERAAADLGGNRVQGMSTRPENDAVLRSWRTWITSESVRRTWLTVKILLSVYDTLKQGWSECPGGLFFTAREGIWSASSAYAWSKACRDGGPLFLQSMRLEGLFGYAKPSEVGEFGRAVLSICFGSEKMDRWVNEAAETSPAGVLDALAFLGGGE